MIERRISHFVLESLLGEGAMGRVYRARDAVLYRPVAIKLLGARTLGDPSFLDRFRREARLAAQLNHPNIATIHAFGVDGDEAYIVMELVEGEDLADRLSRGPLSVEETRKVGRQAASALAAAHARGIIHRDIKTSNLMLTRDGHLKVMDFGVARRAGDTQLTLSGALVGTANIMAPESISGKEPTPASDLFSLGCVLYECLTGRPAFSGTDLVSVLHQVMTHEPTPLVELRADIPEDLARVVHGLLAKDPGRRFGPAGAVEAALSGGGVPVTPRTGAVPAYGPVDATAIVDGPPGATLVGTAPVSSTAAGPRSGRRRTAPVWMVLLALPVLGAGVFLAFTLGRDSARERATRINDRGALLLASAGENVTLDVLGQARALFLEAARTDTTYSVPWNNLGDLDRAAGKLEDAAEGFGHALRLDPRSASAHANLGVVLEALGRLAEAQRAYEAAARWDTAHAVAAGPNNLGHLLLTRGRLQEARGVLDEAIVNYTPTAANAPLWKNHGIAALASGDTAQGRASFERALALHPGYVDALVGLAFLAATGGDSAQVAARWREAGTADRVRARDARRTLAAILGRDLPVTE